MQRHIAYLANFFPSLTETFIYREVVEMRRRGIDVKTYSLRKPDHSCVSEEAVNIHKNTCYLLPVTVLHLLECHIRLLILKPAAYAKTLWKMLTPHHKSLRDRIR